MLSLGRNYSGAGSLDSSALGGVGRKGLPIGTYAPPSVGGSVRRPQQIPRAGAVSLISAYGPKVLVEGDNAIADFRWPMATVLVAVAVAIVGVVVSGQHHLLRPKGQCESPKISMRR